MTSPLVSIIVPVYNVERFLDRCISSIIEQSYANFELIIINDGSVDESLAVCKTWADKDARIVLVDKENGGVSSARNAGLDVANGSWITFIDSDDWINHNYLQDLVHRVAVNHSVDWITSGITYVYSDGRMESVSPKSCETVYSDTPMGLFSIATQPLISSPVGKLYKAEIITSNRLRFNIEIPCGEDRDFNVKYLSLCANCIITDINAYNYRKDIPSSLSSIKAGNDQMNDIDYWSDLYGVFKQKRFLEGKINSFLVNLIYNFVIDYISTYSLNAVLVDKVRHKLDWRYIKENSALIEGNRLYKWLFVHRKIGLLNRLISFRAGR